MKTLVDVNKVFTTLRKKGIHARRGVCCSSCSLAELPDDVGSYAFYHAQDAADFRRTGGMHVAYGYYNEAILAPQDEIDAKILTIGYAIVRAFEDAGFTVRWNEDIKSRIHVQG